MSENNAPENQKDEALSPVCRRAFLKALGRRTMLFGGVGAVSASLSGCPELIDAVICAIDPGQCGYGDSYGDNYSDNYSDSYADYCDYGDTYCDACGYDLISCGGYCDYADYGDFCK